jgi:hypothetical protein
MGRAWPQPGEPLFTDEDIDEILDFLDIEDETHGPCGVPKAEGFSPDSEGEWSAKALRCHACAAIDKAAGDFGSNDKAGLYFTVVREVSAD